MPAAPNEMELTRLRDAARRSPDFTPLPPQLLEKLRRPDLAESDDEPAPMPERIAQYRVLSLRGRGGMGVVYEAMDDALGRRVAVKVLAHGPGNRLRREARAAATLQHENLVPVFAAESPEDGPPYLVMPFIDGPTLADAIAAERVLEPRQAARFVRQIAAGVQALHSAGFIHRDIKPGNILLAKSDSGVVPKLTDFGLAREEAAAGATTGNAIAGTPSYLSPEQIHSPQTVDARADVYALGATLYDALTGVPPFRGATLDVLRRIGEQDPVPPRTLNAGVPRDLETICLKCLEKKPERRYASAAELQNDLERFLENRTILARPAGVFERGVRWVRRNPWAAAVIIVSLLGAAAAGLGWRQADRESRRAAQALIHETEARKDAEEARKQADDQALLALGAINTLVGKAQSLADRSPGTLTLKKQLGEAALADLKKLAAGADRNGASLAAVRAHTRIAEAYKLLGDFPEARRQIDRGLEVAATLPESGEGSQLIGQLNLSKSYVERLSGQAEAAVTSANAAIDAFEVAMKLNPESYESARELAVAINVRADGHLFANRLPQALDNFHQSLKICEGMRDRFGSRSQTVRDLAFTESRIALTESLRFRFDAADRHSAAASRYADEALTLDPANADRQRTARIGVLDRGNILFNKGDYAELERIVRGVLPPLETAAKAEPENVSLQRDLAIGHSLTGGAALGLGRFDAAVEHLDKSLAIRESLGTPAVTDLAQIGDLLMQAEQRRFRYDHCAAVCDRMIAGCDKLAKSAGAQPQIDEFRKRYENWKRSYESIHSVLADPDTLEKQPEDLRALLGCLLALDRARHGRMAEARDVMGRVKAGRDGDVPVQMTATAVHTLLAGAAKSDAERTAELDAAVIAAGNAMKASPFAVYAFLNYSELLPLRMYPPFQKLIEH